MSIPARRMSHWVVTEPDPTRAGPPKRSSRAKARASLGQPPKGPSLRKERGRLGHPADPLVREATMKGGLINYPRDKKNRAEQNNRENNC